jgi:hypothetical protein
MEVISPGWFMWHALVGIVAGYALRLFEHLVWTATQDQETGLRSHDYSAIVRHRCDDGVCIADFVD